MKYGRALFGEALNDKGHAIQILRDALATLRWEMLSEQPPNHRTEEMLETLRRNANYAVAEFGMIDKAAEEASIFRPYIAQQEVFAHLERLVPCRENAFLFKKRGKI